MKISIYCILIIFTIIISSFTVRDFYVPARGFAEVRFYTPDRQFRRTGQTRTIRYIAQGSNAKIIDMLLYDHQIIETDTFVVKFSDLEVTMIVPEVKLILIMPFPRKSAIWKSDDYNCRSTWSYASIGGDNVPAIKVMKTPLAPGREKVIEYYAFETGLWKRDYISKDGLIQCIDVFDGLYK